MRRWVVFLVQMAALGASVPWLFTVHHRTHIAGMPPWARFSLLMTVAYMVLTAVMLRWCWERMAEGPDDE